MNMLSAFFRSSCAVAVVLTLWTMYVWRAMRTTALFSPVNDVVLLHPLSSGHLVFGSQQRRGAPARYCLALQPSNARFVAFMMLSLTPGLNLLAVATGVGVALWLLVLVGWGLVTTPA